MAKLNIELEKFRSYVSLPSCGRSAELLFTKILLFFDRDCRDAMQDWLKFDVRDFIDIFIKIESPSKGWQWRQPEANNGVRSNAPITSSTYRILRAITSSTCECYSALSFGEILTLPNAPYPSTISIAITIPMRLYWVLRRRLWLVIYSRSICIFNPW